VQADACSVVHTYDSVQSVETRKHFWNGRWGSIARTDVFVRVDGDVWIVERRDGGADGRSRFIDADDEDSALDIARDLMIGGDGWRELS
jgi:hypothetical protein